MATPRRRNPTSEGGRGAVTLVIDVVLPVALFYLLRAGGVEQLAALLVSGAPPALRVAYTLVRTRHIDTIGALVLVAVVLAVAGSLIEGDPRTLLIRNALLSFPFAIWMLASLGARRPLTYQTAKALLPSRARAFERAWTDEPAFRHVWRRLTVLWGGGLLLQAAASVLMAYTLPIDAVPGLDTALSVGVFIVLQIITQTVLHRRGTMRMVFAPPAARVGQD
jgi:intracellular septation protein A